VHISSQWRVRGLVILGLVCGHIALFYGASRGHSYTSDANGPPMFGPVVSEFRRENLQHPITSRQWSTTLPDDSNTPAGAWRFAAIDIWPTDRPPIQSTAFTPVSDALPDELAADDTGAAEKWAKSAKHQSKLRMTGWVRPVYTNQEARTGYQGSVLVSVHVNARGQPVEQLLLNSSGYPALDAATLQAARLWQFSPPVWRSEPVSVWAQLEVRYHCCEAAAPAGF
jgi:TonB family protein